MVVLIIKTFSYSIIITTLLALIFDLIFTVLRSFHNKKYISILNFIHDFLFILLMTLNLILTVYFFNNGKVRWFYLLSIIIGILIYNILFRKMIIKIAGLIVLIIVSIFNLIEKGVRKIINFLNNLLKK